MSEIAGTNRQLLTELDTRGDAKLDTFNGGRAKFEQLAIIFENYVHLLGWGTFVENATKLQEPIIHDNLGDEAKAMNGDLYYLLANKVKGPA